MSLQRVGHHWLTFTFTHLKMYSSCYIPFLSKLHHYLSGCTRQKLGISLPIAPSASSTKIYQSCIQWIHTGCLVKNNAWRTLEQIVSFSVVEAGLRAVPKQCTVWPCAMDDQWQTERNPWRTALVEEYLVVPLPMGALQYHLLHSAAQEQMRGSYSNN